MTAFLSIFLVLMTFMASAQTKVAMVKMIRGEAHVLTLGKTTKLNAEDWVEDGAVVKTAEKSFVRLVFVDKSQMNIGPNSEMKIETFSGKESGVIDLVKGTVSSKVTKDYLQIKDKDKSKLFIKTQNAVMGVRGTHFMISTNGINTSTVLFEGEIVFNKLDRRGEVSPERLEEIVNRGVRMFPGEFSVVEANRTMPTVPALLNIQQREKLEKSLEGSPADRAPNNVPSEVSKSVVPAGLNGNIVSNSTEVLKNEVADFVKTETPAAVQSASASDPEGFVKGDLVKPANGSMIHVDSGLIIPPGPTAVFDENTNTYIPGSESGKIAADGSYVPPKNVEITNDGKILVSVTDSKGTVVVKEVPPPAPVVSATVVSTDQASFLNVAQVAPDVSSSQTNATKEQSDIPLPGNGGVDTRFTPTGGISNVNDPTRQNALIDATIIINPN